MAAEIWARLAGATGFQWDEGNATKNWVGHQVSQGECEQVFFGSPFRVAPDMSHSKAEPRFYALGQTAAARRLFLVFTLRGTLIRVISARDMSRQERKAYADAQASETES
ncbi:MAG: BrnT family toxin [Gemmatimonadales bacterium]|nr:BrnT family toxin [Gemmatimonadales bacterium]